MRHPKGGWGTMPENDVTRFILAGTSNMCGATITNPIDVIKIRLQLDNELKKSTGVAAALQDRYYKGMFRGAATIVRDEGVRGLYKGLAASLMRESSYSTIRLGAYEPMKRLFGGTDPAHTPLWKKLASGAVSGMIGSSIATPTDLVKVRLQACQSKPGHKPVYPGTIAAFKDIYSQGGIAGLWRGVGPTVVRATILTATQIPAYDHTKHTLLNLGLLGEGVALHVTSSMVAGFCTAATTSPVDVVKTRYMRQHHKGELYTSAWDCIVKSMRSEGVLGLYKGFVPNWMRIGPHTVITFFVFEQLRKLVGMPPV